MKKLTHIAAPVALTALLSACAGPGPEQMMQEASLYLDVHRALHNPGPGGLEQAVQQALGDNPVEGNLSEALQQALENPGPGGLQQAVQQALDENPAPGNLSQAMQNFGAGGMSQEAVQNAVQQAVQQALVGEEEELLRKVGFTFDFEQASPQRRTDVLKHMRAVIRKEFPSFREVPGPGDHEVTFHVENLEGISKTDIRLIRIEAGIGKISDGITKSTMEPDQGCDAYGATSTLDDDCVEASVVESEPATNVVVLKNKTHRFEVGDAEPGRVAKLEVACQATYRYHIIRKGSGLKVLHIWSEGKYRTERGEDFTYSVDGEVTEVDGKFVCNVTPTNEQRYHYVMAADAEKNITITQYHAIDVVSVSVSEGHHISSFHTERLPACPPDRSEQGWNNLIGDRAGEEFLGVLGGEEKCVRNLRN